MLQLSAGGQVKQDISKVQKNIRTTCGSLRNDVHRVDVLIVELMVSNHTEHFTYERIIMSDLHDAVNGVESINETINTVKGQTCVDTAVNVANIRQSDVFRCREKENIGTIEQYTKRFIDYKEAKERGETPDYPFPRIQVWLNDPQQPEQYILLGGHHRLEAARHAGLDTIPVTVFRGSEDDAFVIAMKDNNGHGLQMTRGDLRQCIERAIKRFSDKSAGVIVDMFDWSRSYVSEIADELSASGQVDVPEKRQGKDGKMYPTKRKKRVKKQSSVDSTTVPGNVTDLASEAVSPTETVINQVLEQGDIQSEFCNVDQPVKSEGERMADFITSIDTFRQTLTGDNKDSIFYHQIIDWLRNHKQDNLLRYYKIDKQTKFVSENNKTPESRPDAALAPSVT